MNTTTTKRYSHFGHSEFRIAYDSDLVVRQDLDWLMAYLEKRIAQAEKFLPDETIQVGWGILKVFCHSDGLLGLFEPDFGENPIRFIESVTSTLRHLRLQKDVAESVGLGDSLSFPSLSQSAIKCSQHDDSNDFYLERVVPSQNDSGWFVGCANPQHDHNNPSNLSRTSLYELACSRGELIPFLALPPECSVLVQNGAPSLQRRGLELPIKEHSFLHALRSRRRE